MPKKIQECCLSTVLTFSTLVHFVVFGFHDGPIFSRCKFEGREFLLVLPSFSFLHKKEVGQVLLRGHFWRKKKIRRFSKPMGRRTTILSL